jgi:hypothetical protein
MLVRDVERIVDFFSFRDIMRRSLDKSLHGGCHSVQGRMVDGCAAQKNSPFHFCHRDGAACT